jgi:hypothetical protein
MNKIPQHIIELSDRMKCPVILIKGKYVVRDIDQCLAMIDDNIDFSIVHWPKLEEYINSHKNDGG